MRVVATKMGHYNQILREVGEVFDLLNYSDGSFPVRKDWVPKLGQDGKPIADEGEYVTYQDKQTGKPVHADYAPDLGDVPITKGPMRGELAQLGWMRRVPDKIPTGLYPPGTDFWSGDIQLPQAIQREVGPDARTAAPIRRSLPKVAAGE